MKGPWDLCFISCDMRNLQLSQNKKFDYITLQWSWRPSAYPPTPTTITALRPEGATHEEQTRDGAVTSGCQRQGLPLPLPGWGFSLLNPRV